jgi:uncharacterized damage-inducible protein DinB
MTTQVVTNWKKEWFDIEDASYLNTAAHTVMPRGETVRKRHDEAGALMLILNDQHEHMGQSIAYARSNSVVPPWSK